MTTYTTEKTDGGELYSTNERTGCWEGSIGDYTVDLYSHPNGVFAWHEVYHTVQADKARAAALRWCRDGVEPRGITRK